MWISTKFETRAYPEIWPACRTETELEFMASLSLRGNPGNKSYLIEPGSNPNRSRKVFETMALSIAVHSGHDGMIG